MAEAERPGRGLEKENTMSKMIETLKKAGWVETTLGECQMGEEVLLGPAGPCPRATRVAQPAEWGGEKEPFFNTSDGGIRRGTTPVLRAPRPECAPGTVALITWDEDKPLVRAWKVPGQWILTGGIPLDDDSVEVVRVLLLADQDTPTVEVTDEMVERGALGLVDGDEWPTNEELGGNLTGTRDDEFRDSCREEARRVLEAALGVEK